MGEAGTKRSLAWLRLAVVLAAVVPSALFGAAAWLGHREAVRAAEQRLGEVARSAEEQAAGVLARNDLVMQQMLRLLKDDDDAALQERESELHAVALAVRLRFPYIRSLSVWAADGRLLASSAFFPVPRSLEPADWRYFRDDPMDAGGEPLFRVTKQRAASSSGPGPVVEMSFSPSHFIASQRPAAEHDEPITVALLDAEGAILGEWPEPRWRGLQLHENAGLAVRIKAAERQGVLRGGALAVGDRRFAAFRKVGNHPLYVACFEDAESVFAPWKRELWTLAALLAPITLGLVLASLVALRRTRRVIEVRERLREESEQRRLAEEALRHAQRMDALGHLAGGMAHDFNNLLTVVSNSAELLARTLPEAAPRPELAAILRAVASGSRLTRRLLRFSRRQGLRPEIVRLGAALEDMLDTLRATAGSGVVVTVEAAADTPAIEVDAAELEIALINLVANARDAMRGEGEVRISARCAAASAPRAAHASCVEIRVADSGAGMDAETLRRACEPFFTTKPSGRGTGLGLSQVAGFCAQAGGRVEIASEARKGTTVSMFLPCAQASHAANDKVAAAAVRPPAQRRSSF